MNRLSEELILRVLDYLSSEKFQLSLAMVNKKTWFIATVPRKEPFTLQSRIGALNLHRSSHLIIGNRFYEPEFVEHVFTYAVNLKSVKFEYRDKFSFKFVKMFMKVKKDCIFYIPLTSYDTFELAVQNFLEKKLVLLRVYDMDSVKEVKTPEHIVQDMNLRKAIKKAVYVAESSNMVQFKDNLSHLVSPKKNLFDPGNYVVYNYCHQSSVISTHKQAQDVVSHCCKFVELVTIIDDHWFFITSFSVFIHDSNLDDCADASRVGLQLSAVAFIRKKTRAGKDYFEFTLRFNNVELLATSGFFGCVDDDTVAAFVGSSVQGLPKSIIERYDTLSSTYIFITKAIAPSIAVERLINQYLKRDAAKKWMLVSKRFKEKGFEPSHPLSFDSMVPIQKAASLLMKIIAHKALYRDAVKESIAELKDKRGKKLTASGKLARRYLITFSVQSAYQQNEYDEVKMKRDMLYIYENTLAGPLKSRNLRVAKQAITDLISGPLEDE